mgnify:CR=1 FL=1
MSLEKYEPGELILDDELNCCFPEHGLIHEYLWWVRQTTDAPPWWSLGAILSCLAHEAARHGFRIDQRQMIKPSLWVAILGPSSIGKSTAMARAADFYKTYLEIEDATDPFVHAEGTIPGIFERLVEMPTYGDDELHAAILYQDEFSRLLDQRDTVAEMLMKMADGHVIDRNLVRVHEKRRQGEGSYSRLEHHAISAMFATTHSNLRRVIKGHHIEGGLLSRMLWFIAKAPKEFMLHPSLLPAKRAVALAAWTDWSGWLLAQSVESGSRVVQISDEVDAILEATLFEDWVQTAATDDRLNPTRRRAIGQAYTVAGLYALSCRRTSINSDDMDQAVNLIERCIRDLENWEPELATSDIMAAVNKGFRQIVRAGDAGLGRSKLYQALRAPKAIIDQVLQTLIDEGSIREDRAKANGRPGRPAIRYIANGRHRFCGESAEPDRAAKVVQLPSRKA